MSRSSDDVELGQRTKAERKEQGLTKRKLAERIQCSVRTITNVKTAEEVGLGKAFARSYGLKSSQPKNMAATLLMFIKTTWVIFMRTDLIFHLRG